MRQWLCKIICRDTTEGEDNGRMDAILMEQRIRDIRRRIEEQRARLGHTQARSTTIHRTNEVAQQKPNVDPTREAKNAELNNLKAKLLGKKQ
jgi:hypothetical protein